MTETDPSGDFFSGTNPPFPVGPAKGSEWGLPGVWGAGLLSGYFRVVSGRRWSHLVRWRNARGLLGNRANSG